MRITQAAQRLGTSARMLRYRDTLGLLPPVREPAPGQPRTGQPRTAQPRTAQSPTALSSAGGPAGRPLAGPSPAGGSAHRQFREEDLAAVALALDIERRRDISPAELAFGLRVLA